MIVYYLGIPGSGKSYSGVYTIYNNFSDDKKAKKDLKKDYLNCYTNINEFKFELLNDVYKFESDKFLDAITILHNMYKDKKSDEELIEKAKELNIYKSLFVIDECHNLLDVQKPILVWWLTYHRHLYHDIILITQNLALVNSKYKPLAEAFYRAKPNSLVLNKRYFHYTYFTDSRMSAASKVNVKKVKKEKKVFELYQSGDSVKSKNVILYFIGIAFFIALIVGLLMFFFFENKSEYIEKEKEHVSQNKKIQYKKVAFSSLRSSSNKAVDFSNKKILIFQCSNSVCTFQNISLPPQLVKKFMDMDLLHNYYTERINDSLSVFYMSADKEFYRFLNSKKRGDDEDNSMDVDASKFFRDSE